MISITLVFCPEASVGDMICAISCCDIDAQVCASLCLLIAASAANSLSVLVGGGHVLPKRLPRSNRRCAASAARRRRSCALIATGLDPPSLSPRVRKPAPGQYPRRCAVEYSSVSFCSVM